MTTSKKEEYKYFSYTEMSICRNWRLRLSILVQSVPVIPVKVYQLFLMALAYQVL